MVMHENPQNLSHGLLQLL